MPQEAAAATASEKLRGDGGADDDDGGSAAGGGSGGRGAHFRLDITAVVVAVSSCREVLVTLLS